MPCDTRLKPRQTISQRKDEVRRAVDKIDAALKAGRAKAIVDRKTGAVAFQGVTDDERDGVTDACVYRRLMVTGSALTRQALQRAEQLAGRSVNKDALAQGVHSHDGGQNWHHGH